jgi:hypothetical protein
MNVELITWDNIKPFLELNVCVKCNGQDQLHECNSCLELHCTKCDLMKYAWCHYCQTTFTHRFLKRKRKAMKYKKIN